MIKIGTITLNFKPKYEGTHRVCWRIVGDVDYICEEIQCKSLDCDCEYKLSVNAEPCNDIEIEGYIQPTCEVITSTTNRVSFSSSLTKSASACTKYSIIYDNLVLDDSNILFINQGTGYPAGTIPVTVSGGGGTGMILQATGFGFGQVNTLTIVDPGSGYTTPPTITIDPPTSGTQATATFVLSTYNYKVPTTCTSTSSNDFGLIYNANPTYSVCSNIEPDLAEGLSSVASGECSCNCTSVTLTANSDYGFFKYYFYDCFGVLKTGTMDVGDSETFCMNADTLVIDLSFLCDDIAFCPSQPPTITYGAACSE